MKVARPYRTVHELGSPRRASGGCPDDRRETGFLRPKGLSLGPGLPPGCPRSLAARPQMCAFFLTSLGFDKAYPIEDSEDPLSATGHVVCQRGWAEGRPGSREGRLPGCACARVSRRGWLAFARVRGLSKQGPQRVRAPSRPSAEGLRGGTEAAAPRCVSLA